MKVMERWLSEYTQHKYDSTPKVENYANCGRCGKLMKRTALLKGKCVSCNKKK